MKAGSKHETHAARREEEEGMPGPVAACVPGEISREIQGEDGLVAGGLPGNRGGLPVGDRPEIDRWTISDDTSAIVRSCPSAKSTEVTFTAEDLNGTKELTLFATDKGLRFSSRFLRTN